MPAIRTRLNLQKPGFTLTVDLALPTRGVTAFFGPSGSGKTTLLRCIAGLERVPNGLVSLGDHIWQDAGQWLPTHKRSVGYVFQEASLFAHLSVIGNLRYGVKRAQSSEALSLEQAIELLGIAHLLDRKPEFLSGGERQRVAIARALAVRPQLLLMDEPLAALDMKRKQEILPFLERLTRELDIPIIYVSHSIDEVARLADHLVLIDAGRVTASGPTAELMTRLDLPLAHGDTAGAVLTAIVLSHDDEDHLTTAFFCGNTLTVPRQQVPTGQALRIRVQARDVSLTLHAQSGTSILNILSATVTALSPDSAGQVMVMLDVGGCSLLARLTTRSARALALAPGLTVFAQIKGVAILG
jgi:molybdate transport system ATP-binding protein